MAVFRVERNKGYTVMSNHHLRNRKQEIDRQHHTIPNQRNQRPKDKHYGKIQKFRFFHNADDYEISHIHTFLKNIL